jgi:hypothetical protein
MKLMCRGVFFLLLFAFVTTDGSAHVDPIFALFGYNVDEESFFLTEPTLDKKTLRQLALTLDEPPANLKLNENFYAGARVGSERHGVGTLTIGGPTPTTNNVHLGVFKRHKRQGYSIVEVFEDGVSAVYVGDYWNDKQHGQGIYQSDGHLYDGQWLFGLQWGAGRYASANWTYVGDWVQGEPDGHGIEIAGGIQHVGLWVKGKKHGPGKYWDKRSGFE